MQRFSNLRKRYTLEINDVLLGLGYKTNCYMDDFFEIHFQDNLVYGRVLIDEKVIQFGYKKTFDRWGNSVDFTINIPKSVEKLEEMIIKFKENRVITN